MVALSTHYNFRSVIEEFFALKSFNGPHGPALKEMVRMRAHEILAHPDIRYMPAFKILDLLAAMVNSASEVAAESQLRLTEATVLVNRMFSDHAPIIRQFILEAALERARYEPMMIDETNADAQSLRDLTLIKRWRAMASAHQALTDLPAEWLAVIDQAVQGAIADSAFAEFRQGPLLQLFADMLQTARLMHTEKKPVDALERALRKNGPLWKRYALKTSRYKDEPQARMLVSTLTTPSTLH